MRGAVVGSLPGALGIAAHCMAGDGMPPSRSAVALLLLFGGKLFCPSGTGTFTDALRVRQSVAVTVDPAEKLEVLDESFMPIEQCGGGALGAFQGQRLIEAGSERRVGDIVGHYFQQLVAFVRRKRTGRHRPVDRELDIDFQIRGRNARSIVDKSPSHRPPWWAYSIRAARVMPRFPPSPTIRARRSRASTRTRSLDGSPTAA